MSGFAAGHVNASPHADFAAPAVDIERRPDGTLVLRSGHALPAELPLVTQRLAHWAATAPQRAAFVECRAGRLARSIDYRETAERSARLAAWLTRYPLSPQRPLLIVADSGIDHALLRIAALRAGLPFAPLSTQLLRFTGGPARLLEIVRRLRPGLVCADDAEALRALLRGAGFDDLAVLGIAEAARQAEAECGVECGAGGGANPARPAAPALEAAPTLDDVAAIFFTSGSTGSPKGVITTHRMLSANQAAIATLWPLLAQEPPRLLDWLPWHHTFGGNDNFHKMLWHGGTLYLDDGQPTPEGMGRTIANLDLAEPTLHINVPRGLELLLDALDRDAPARARFLHSLRVIFFAGAGLSSATWDRLRALVDGHAAAGGRPIALVSGWGSTECGSTICLVHFAIDGPRAVGLPLPGYALKLVPAGDKLEARVRGPNVTPGYWPPGQGDRSAFDDEGFFCTGDAVRLLDAQRPRSGLVFDGRIAEDFKLSTGTWVSVGPLRLALLAALAPWVREVAIAGHDRHFIAVLLFLEPASCAALCAGAAADAIADMTEAPALRARLTAALQAHNARQGGSSGRIRRAILIAEPPSAEAGEINEKGYLHQRSALARRATLVNRLYQDVADAGVLCP